VLETPPRIEHHGDGHGHEREGAHLTLTVGGDDAFALAVLGIVKMRLNVSDLDVVLDGFAENLGEVSGVNFAPEESAAAKG